MTETIDLIGLGELLWDCFPDRRLPGGAPANVAFHAKQLGLNASVASRVGQDELGRELCEFLESQGLKTDLIQRDQNHPTGTVTVDPSSTAEINYQFLENSAWDYLELNSEWLEAVRSTRAICFGTLAQRRPTSRTAIHRCLQHISYRSLIVYDVNIRPPFVNKDWIKKSLERCTIVKMNDGEVKILAHLLEFPSTDDVRFAKWLLDEHKRLEVVCITRGSQGCLAVTCDETYDLPGIPTVVADTVGAGDAFTAAIIYGQLEGWPLSKTLDLANRFGALVASRPGAMPDLKAELDAVKTELEWSYRITPTHNG
ncbi:carbohydrate kinase family protein [Schlesneria paludicola]|uniref:carbohydrate kinase family protein n=1 Tax=Schlesneria paludicola TaxID=360056 RepID=UPI00029B3989|nr:carbohydrate kinase [Schlesneria paludicola]